MSWGALAAYATVFGLTLIYMGVLWAIVMVIGMGIAHWLE